MNERDRTWAVILAGGEGTRLSSLTSALYGQPMPKQFAALDVGWNDWGTPARVLASLRGKPSEKRLRACLENQSSAVA